MPRYSDRARSIPFDFRAIFTYTLATRTCNTCGGTSTPMVGSGVGGTGLGGAAAGRCCCKLCRNSASRLSCSCSCSRISCSFSCVRDVGVAVLNVGGLKKEDTLRYISFACSPLSIHLRHGPPFPRPKVALAIYIRAISRDVRARTSFIAYRP